MKYTRNYVHKAAPLLGLALLGSAGAAWSQAEAQRTVSSDGSVLMVPPAPSGTAGASFTGAQAEGAAPDAKAEFPAFTLSGAALAEFRRRYPPKLPPYAGAGGDRGQPEAVLGPDRRFRLYPRESGFPYRAIGYLTFTQSGFEFSCTAFLISKDTVATAGHCVHEGSGGGWSRDVKFYPAFNNGVAPFGSCGARRLHAVAKWTEQGLPEFDYGAIKLNCAIGETTGWFGYYATTDSQLGLAVLVVGYPGDKMQGTMWGGAGSVVATEARKTHYQIDTAGGQSGAPVIEADRGASKDHCFGTCVVAIHAYADFGVSNSGTRINQAVAGNLTAWKNAP
jgi:glutamyl endopeptidase